MAFSLGPTDKKYISAFGIDKRDWLPQLLDLDNEEYLTDIMEISGRYKLAIEPEYSHFVSDASFYLLDTTGATVSGTTTITTTFTAATSGWARPTDLVIFPNKKVGEIKTVTPSGGQDTVTIQSVNGTTLTHTAGQKLSIISNAFGEKSTAPVNRKVGQTQYTNKIQIFREVNEITDVQEGSEIELEYKGSNYVIDRDLAMKDFTFKTYINATIIGGSLSVTKFSDTSPALTDPIAGGATQTTRGLNEYIETYGVNDSVASAGTWNFADLDDTISQLLANKTGKSYLVLRSTKAAMKMDAYMKGINTGISAGKLSLDAKTFDYMVDGFSYGNFNFQFSSMGILDSNEFFSQTDIARSIFFIPKDQVAVKGGGTQPRIQMRYQKHGVKNAVGDEIHARWETGANAVGGPTNDEAVRRTNWKSHQGLEVLGAKHFAKCVVL